MALFGTTYKQCLFVYKEKNHFYKLKMCLDGNKITAIYNEFKQIHKS